MKIFCILASLVLSLNLSVANTNKVETVNVYAENTLILSKSQLADKNYTAMTKEDVSFISSILENNAATASSPVSPAAGGIFCIIDLEDGQSMHVRITSNVFVVEEIKGSQEGFCFYALDDAQKNHIAEILSKYTPEA